MIVHFFISNDFENCVLHAFLPRPAADRKENKLKNIKTNYRGTFFRPGIASPPCTLE